MKQISFILIIFLALTSCNLNKIVEIELPAYTDQPVVECYLIPGQRYELLLTHSNSFFDPLTGSEPAAFLQSILEFGARVTIIHGGDTIELKEKLELNSISGFVSNYSNDTHVSEDFTDTFHLHIVLSNGSVINSSTVIPHIASLDSTRVDYANNRKTRATVLAYHRDNPDTEDYYRRMIHINSLDSLPLQNYTTDDKINHSEEVAFGAIYERKDKQPVIGDTMIISLSHITKEYHEFFTSITNANLANGNPFGQPGQIKSNVAGASNPIGIFTGFVSRRDTVIFQ